MALNALGENIWEISHPMRVLGVEFGHRMTVIRLASGDLWVHSPVALDTLIKADLENLGVPRYFVAPNTFHDMYWKPYFETYNSAEFWSAPGMSSKLDFGEVLQEEAPAVWQDDLEQIPIGGMPSINEYVFLHKKSCTLIIADLVFNLDKGDGFYSRNMLKMMGAYGGVCTSRLYRAFVKDKVALRDSIDRVLTLDFDRIVVGHGANVMLDGKKALEQAYSFL